MDPLISSNTKTPYSDANYLAAEGLTQQKILNAKSSFQELNQKNYSQSKKADEGLRDFQGLMVGLMLNSMRSTIQKNESFNGGQGEEIFQDMLDQEYSKKLASTDMLGMDKSLRKSFKLPLNETFNWSEIEKIPDESLQNIKHQLDGIHRSHEIRESAKETLSATVSKKLDDVVKIKDLLEKLPPEEIKKLDPEFLKAWKEKREVYLKEKGLNGEIGPGLQKINKDLLQHVFGELQQIEKKPLMGEKRKAAAAYSKNTLILK